MHRLTSAAEQVIRSFWDIMPDPELSERFWTGKLPLRSFKKTICLEAGSKVKPERRVESPPNAPGFCHGLPCAGWHP